MNININSGGPQAAFGPRGGFGPRGRGGFGGPGGGNPMMRMMGMMMKLMQGMMGQMGGQAGGPGQGGCPCCGGGQCAQTILGVCGHLWAALTCKTHVTAPTGYCVRWCLVISR